MPPVNSSLYSPPPLAQPFRLSALGVVIPATTGAGSFTAGVSLVVAQPVYCKGVRFFWLAANGARNVKASLWDNAGTRLANVTLAVAAASAMIEARFSAPVLLSPNQLYTIGYWETSGTNYVRGLIAALNAWMPARPFFIGQAVAIEQVTLFGAADTKPTTTAATEGYLCEPIIG